uniref:L1 transposable element dsRBD-like domain-containing protein n=1 Tax=Equus caballus TaxID=9796 RepID=A0A9L0T5J5_HORSE
MKITYKGASIMILALFSAEKFQDGREWNDIFKILKSKTFQPRIIYPANLAFTYDGGTKTFSDKQKLRESTATRPPLPEMMKEVLIPEMKGKGLQNFEQGDIYTKSENCNSPSEQVIKHLIIT